jgi:hypothetical protein
VRWYDHHRSRDTWAEPTPPADLKGSRIESKGWLLGESDTAIEISNHRPMDEDDVDWGTPMRIAKLAIFYRSDEAKQRKTTNEGSKQ